MFLDGYISTILIPIWNFSIYGFLNWIDSKVCLATSCLYRELYTYMDLDRVNKQIEENNAYSSTQYN